MPGIFGFVTRAVGSPTVEGHADRVLGRMAAAMMYEPFYTSDLRAFPEAGAWIGRVGHRMRPTAEDAVMPGGTPESAVAVMTAGEPRSLDALTGAEDAPMLAYGPGASAAAGRYLREGVPGLESGDFAGVLVDRRLRHCFVFNDRFGAERIFIHRTADRTYFASEAKAILAVAPATRSLQAQGLAELLSCGGTLGRTSLFSGIDVLDAGSLLTFQAGVPVAARSGLGWSTVEGGEPQGEREFVRDFIDALTTSVERASALAPAAAISLTGGLDSRMIMASLPESDVLAPCYTFAGMYRDSFDVIVARRVAASCGHPFHALVLGKSFLTNLADLLERSVYIADGYLGLSGAAELFVNQQARTQAPARITGNWGGELLRGVRAFKYVPPRSNYVRPHVMDEVRKSARLFADADAATPNPLSYTLLRQLPVQGYGRNAIERSQVLIRSPFLDTRVVNLLYRAAPTLRSSNVLTSSVIGRRPALMEIATDLGRLGPAGLRGEVRRSYRTGLAKAEYFVSHGAPDWIVKATANPFGRVVERHILGRHKFQHFRRWLRDDLSAYVRQSLSDSAADLSPWLDAAALRTMAERHIAGRANHTDELDQALTLAATLRTLLRADRYVAPEREHAGWPTAWRSTPAEVLR